MVLVKNAASIEKLLPLQRQLSENFKITIPELPNSPVISGSVGCIYASCRDDFETVFQNADLAMYEEKERLHAARR